MNIKFFLQKVGTLCLCLFIASCINLKQVNDYASSSSKNIMQFEELGYDFMKSCNDKCVISQLEQKQFLKQNCDCNTSKDADSVTLMLYNAVKGYFEGLSKISNNELATYKFDALAKALKEGNLGDIEINKDNVDSYAKISSILTSAITEGYRKRKISKYVREANDAIKNLLEALEFNLVSNLSKTLETKRESLKSYYFDLFDDPTLSTYEKVNILEEFNRYNLEINFKKKQIAAFGMGLDAIVQGHQKLFEDRNRLGTKEFKKSFSQYSSNLQDIITEINKIKNQS